MQVYSCEGYYSLSTCLNNGATISFSFQFLKFATLYGALEDFTKQVRINNLVLVSFLMNPSNDDIRNDVWMSLFYTKAHKFVFSYVTASSIF